MYDIKNLSIWKPKEDPENQRKAYLKADLAELNLSTRSGNCLRRAGCRTIADILELIDEDGNGLRNLHNLGIRSEREILEAVQAYKESSACEGGVPGTDEEKKAKDADVLIIKRKQMRSELGLWETDIDAFDLSDYALTRLKNSGIRRVKDLYATNPKSEPGWYAVRELFEKIDVS